MELQIANVIVLMTWLDILVTLFVLIECLTNHEKSWIRTYLAVSSGGLLRTSLNGTLSVNSGNLAAWYIIHTIGMYYIGFYIYAKSNKVRYVFNNINRYTGLFVPFYVLFGMINSGKINIVLSGVITGTAGGTVIAILKSIEEKSFSPMKNRIIPVALAAYDCMLFTIESSVRMILACVMTHFLVAIVTNDLNTIYDSPESNMKHNISSNFYHLLKYVFNTYCQKYISMKMKSENTKAT